MQITGTKFNRRTLESRLSRDSRWALPTRSETRGHGQKFATFAPKVASGRLPENKTNLKTKQMANKRSYPLTQYQPSDSNETLELDTKPTFQRDIQRTSNDIF